MPLKDQNALILPLINNFEHKQSLGGIGIGILPLSQDFITPV